MVSICPLMFSSGLLLFGPMGPDALNSIIPFLLSFFYARALYSSLGSFLLNGNNCLLCLSA